MGIESNRRKPPSAVLAAAAESTVAEAIAKVGVRRLDLGF